MHACYDENVTESGTNTSPVQLHQSKKMSMPSVDESDSVVTVQRRKSEAPSIGSQLSSSYSKSDSVTRNAAAAAAADIIGES